MSFTGTEDQSITLTNASTMTENYRNSVSSGATIGLYFAKTGINNILAQTNCVGIRIYYAIDSTGAQQMVIVGVDSSENDLYNGCLIDRGYPCPTYCSTSNSLNTTP